MSPTVEQFAVGIEPIVSGSTSTDVSGLISRLTSNTAGHDFVILPIVRPALEDRFLQHTADSSSSSSSSAVAAAVNAGYPSNVPAEVSAQQRLQRLDITTQSDGQPILPPHSLLPAPLLPATGVPFSPSDLVIQDTYYSSQLVGRVSEWLDLDSSDVAARITAEYEFERELKWAVHLGLSTIMLPPMPSHGAAVIAGNLSPNYMRFVNRALQMVNYNQVWVRVPLTSSGQEAWNQWTRLKTACDHNPKLHVALELQPDLPDIPKSLQQWVAEPVKCVILPTGIFQTGPKGYPVLGQAHQNALKKFMPFKVSFAVRQESSDSVYSSPALGASSGDHQRCIRSVIKQIQQQRAAQLEREQERQLQPTFSDATNEPSPSADLDEIAQGYQDCLQSPLQPLMDHLSSATYEAFERDPVKYMQYEEAIFAALREYIPPEEANTRTAVIMVVGAGRGPIVHRALRAADRAQRKVRVYAVEKNPNAFVTLQQIRQQAWGDRVSVVFSDMRFWDAPEKADILVSELLGSFGDNELSPECLDGAQRLLKAGGISIPSSYEAYVAPMSSSKLHADVAAFKSTSHFETPYVVMFQATDLIAEPQQVWGFVHPNPSVGGGGSGSGGSSSSSGGSGGPASAKRTPSASESTVPIKGSSVIDIDAVAAGGSNWHNTRYKSSTFTASHTCMLHGLAGYFEATLYKNVKLSIHPRRHSPGMFSWFPMFFPLRTPIVVPKGSTISVHIWRQTTNTKVWYEWSTTVAFNATSSGEGSDGAEPILIETPIHNTGGRSSWIGL
ncbi:PRMT5-domain-containing protein [Ramicandelaber brevisporus]|nr:PRMT5-domain-containing protein [Ramicandelaber brevisporus]